VQIYDSTRHETFDYAVDQLAHIPAHVAILLLASFRDCQQPDAQTVVSTEQIRSVLQEYRDRIAFLQVTPVSMLHVARHIIARRGLLVMFQGGSARVAPPCRRFASSQFVHRWTADSAATALPCLVLPCLRLLGVNVRHVCMMREPSAYVPARSRR
jgi:hypothetical protein